MPVEMLFKQIHRIRAEAYRAQVSAANRAMPSGLREPVHALLHVLSNEHKRDPARAWALLQTLWNSELLPQLEKRLPELNVVACFSITIFTAYLAHQGNLDRMLADFCPDSDEHPPA